jgi:hypothetical protein
MVAGDAEVQLEKLTERDARRPRRAREWTDALQARWDEIAPTPIVIYHSDQLSCRPHRGGGVLQCRG